METLELKPAAPQIKDLPEIGSLDEYMATYGKLLGQQAIRSLDPLHVPNRDPLIDFDDLLRDPFPCQSHAITASVKAFNERGSVWINGEMGTGKTLMGMAAVHKHACLSRKKGGYGGNYRAIVLCPDHLIGKWEREIITTIPGAQVTRFGPRRSFDDDLESGHKRRVKGKKADKQVAASRQSLHDTLKLLDMAQGKKWLKPRGAQWFVMGRNQAKWLSDWIGLADEVQDFDDTGSKATGDPGRRKSTGIRSSKTVIVDHKHVLDEHGCTVYDSKTNRPKREAITAKVFTCPSCGKIAINQKGSPLGAKDLSSEGKNATQKRCDGRYMVSKPDPDKPNLRRDRMRVPSKFGKVTQGMEIKHAGRTWEVHECREPLYSYVSRPYRWAPARIIQKKLKRFFKYLVIDEVHEHKSELSAQSMACGKLMAAVDHIMALTGTLIGGYADHLFPLLMRICGQSLREEGFEWGKDLPFSEKYGRIDRIVTTSENVSTSVTGNSKSMRRAKTGKSQERKAVRPGIMPPLFANHLIGNVIFVTLEELAEELPHLFEYVGGPLPAFMDDSEWSVERREVEQDHYDRMASGWVDTAVEMLPEQKAEYDYVSAVLELANRNLLQKGSMKLLGATLHTLLGYPDKPFGWDHDAEVKKALAAAGGTEAPPLLGQTFLSHFHYQFEPGTETLVLKKTDDEGNTETDRIPLKKDGGVYNLDVVINGKTKVLCYDTGASTISLPESWVDELGLPPKEGDEKVNAQIADGSLVEAQSTKLASVRVGKFTLANVTCTIMPPGKLPHTIGYWDKPGIRTIDNWVGVVTPKSLSHDVVYPKEAKLIEICKLQKEHGFQTWVGVQMTGKRNIQPRLKALLEAAGLKVGVLRANDVDPREREEWIEAHGGDYDVMISHPKLISTGLDLFSKEEGGHNFNAIVLYQTGYNTFDMRQFSRRAWRIGQPRDCRVYYLYYKGTMQHRAIDLVSKKLFAAQALEGEFSSEGLAAMAGDENMAMAMAKSMSEHIDESDVQRKWVRVKGTTKKPRALEERGSQIPPSPLDRLPIELQMAAEEILELMDSDLPDAAEDAYNEIADRLDATDLSDAQGDLGIIDGDDVECPSGFDDELVAVAMRIYGDQEPDVQSDEVEADELEVTWEEDEAVIAAEDKQFAAKVERISESGLKDPAIPRKTFNVMPRVQDLISMTDAMRSAFNWLSDDPDQFKSATEIHCIHETARKLVAMGLAEESNVAYRCGLWGQPLQDTLTWLKLYTSWDGLYLPLGIVTVMHPKHGPHYAKITNHRALKNAVELLPIDGFPQVSSIPLIAGQKELEEWSIVSASDEDKAAIRAAGIGLGSDQVPEGLVDAIGERNAENSAPEPADPRSEPQPKKRQEMNAESANLPEVTEDILSRMIANMMANDAV